MIETGYLFQAALVLSWWLGLVSSERFLHAFLFPNSNPTMFYAFFLPDLVVVAVLSLIRAYKTIRSLELIIFGGFAYATLYCLNASFLTSGGYLSTLLMLLGTLFNGFLCFHQQLFKISSTSNIYINALKTLIQITCCWLITLAMIPYLILVAFGVRATPVNETRLFVGLALFLFFAFIGLWSAFLFVTQGQGTPLPMDQTRQLVTSGPYRYVRNPMAVAGIGQMLSISLILGAVPLVAYSLLGAVVWHVVVRPIEERDLLERFGQPYANYRERVRCWIPVFSRNIK